MTDFDYMNLAFCLALKAKGKTSPNPLVGAVIVKKGEVVGRGFHRGCGQDHAEIIALRQAGSLAKGATLYVTLEPCSHFGRTPPCVDAIIHSGIKRVVVGTKDLNPVNNGKSFLKLKKNGIDVKVGILNQDLMKINEAFFKFIRYKIPFVVVKCAQTLDGKIATAQGHSKWVTSKTTRKYSHRLRNDFDAILVGINTVLKDNPSLNALCKTKKIKKIVVDSSLRIPLHGNLYKKTDFQNIVVATTKNADPVKLKKLRKIGIRVIICSSQKGKVNLRFLLKELAKQNVMSVLIEGGAQVIGSALSEKVVDKIWFFIAPKVLGDHKALSSVQGLTVKNVNQAIRLKDLSIKLLGEEVLIEGYLRN